MSRRCLFCTKELPDELHGSRKFCADINPDGSYAIGDSICKTRHNNKKIKDRDDDLFKYLKYHKRAGSQLAIMYRRHKDFFTEDELRDAGILTTAPLRLIVDENGKMGLVFRNFALKSVDINKYKIIKYDHRQLETLFS